MNLVCQQFIFDLSIANFYAISPTQTLTAVKLSGELSVANVPWSLSEFRKHEASNDSCESCPVIQPSVEHSRKLKINANPSFFLILLDLHT